MNNKIIKSKNEKEMGCYIMAAIMLCNAAGCGGTNNPREQGTNTPGSAIETADLQQQKILDDEVKEELGVGELHGEGANPFRKQTEKAKILYVKDFGAKGDGINNDGSPIRKAITTLKKADPGSRLVFEPNTTYYVSSGDYALLLQNMKDIIIQGENTTILVKPIMGLCLVQNCNNIIIEGINFDYKTKPYAIADVISDRGDGVVHIRTDRSLNIRGTYKQPTPDFFGLVDRQDGRYHVGITSIKVINADEYIYEVRCNEGFAERDKRIKMMLNERYQFIVPMPNVGQAIEQGLTIIENKDFTMQNCNIWSAAKFMFFLRGNEGIVKFRNVHLSPAPGEEDAHMVGWRDGFHCKENRAQLVWENCSAKYLYDDIFNISASMLEVQKIEGETLHLYWQETGSAYTQIRKGDLISFFDTASGERIGTGTVKRAIPSDSIMKVILEEPLQAVVDSLAAPGSVIWNCNFHGTFRFRSPIYIVGSRLHVTRMWLNVEAPWEGPVTNHVLFSNCEFTFDNEKEVFIHVGSKNDKWEKADDPYRVRKIIFFHCKIRQNAAEIGEAEQKYDEVRFQQCYE